MPQRIVHQQPDGESIPVQLLASRIIWYNSLKSKKTGYGGGKSFKISRRSTASSEKLPLAVTPPLWDMHKQRAAEASRSTVRAEVNVKMKNAVTGSVKPSNSRSLLPTDTGSVAVHRCRGFTLIEVVVVLTIIGILVALILPAIQAAREGGRRIQCMNNLKQIALGMHNYETLNGVFPMGTPSYKYPDVGYHIGQSCFVSILNYIDEIPTYNAINFSRNIYTYSNHTVQSHAVGIMTCPSDGTASLKFQYPSSYQDMPARVFQIAYTNYAGSSGIWYHYTNSPELQALLSKQDNGCFYVNSSVRTADITDGMTCTILIGERAHGRLKPPAREIWHWWFDGYCADTLFWTIHPPNSGLPSKMNNNLYALDETDVYSAGSYHPGGACFAFGDGSVKFIKDSIDSWPIDITTGRPEGVTGDPVTIYRLVPGTAKGVYQALSTRSGGEVTDSNSL